MAEKKSAAPLRPPCENCPYFKYMQLGGDSPDEKLLLMAGLVHRGIQIGRCMELTRLSNLLQADPETRHLYERLNKAEVG